MRGENIFHHDGNQLGRLTIRVWLEAKGVRGKGRSLIHESVDQIDLNFTVDMVNRDVPPQTNRRLVTFSR